MKEILASRKKRSVILKWLATQFERGSRYPEAGVNESIIKRHRPDAATLRRELTGHDRMQRENGVYWRASSRAEDARADAGGEGR